MSDNYKPQGDQDWKAPTTPEGKTPKNLSDLEKALKTRYTGESTVPLNKKLAPGEFSKKFRGEMADTAMKGLEDIAREGVEDITMETFANFNAARPDGQERIAAIIKNILHNKNANVSLVKKMEGYFERESQKPGVTVANAVTELAGDIHKNFLQLALKYPKIFDKYFDNMGDTLPGKAADVKNLFEHALSASCNEEPLNVDELN